MHRLAPARVDSIIDHRGYTDHDFMNLFTGGFYDYADFQMAVCTNTMDSVEHTTTLPL